MLMTQRLLPSLLAVFMFLPSVARASDAPRTAYTRALGQERAVRDANDHASAASIRLPSTAPSTELRPGKAEATRVERSEATRMERVEPTRRVAEPTRVGAESTRSEKPEAMRPEKADASATTEPVMLKDIRRSL